MLYASTAVCEDAKKTEETIVFFVTFLSLVEFQLGGPGPSGPHLANPKLGAYDKGKNDIPSGYPADPKLSENVSK